MNTTAEFIPLNEFEQLMLSAKAGETTHFELMSRLVDNQVVVLLDQDIPESGWHDGISLLMLNNPAGQTLLAAFTSLERAIPWASPEDSHFKFAVHVEFSWLLQRIAPDVGMVINPAGILGFEINPAGLDELKAELLTRIN